MGAPAAPVSALKLSDRYRVLEKRKDLLWPVVFS